MFSLFSKKIKFFVLFCLLTQQLLQYTQYIDAPIVIASLSHGYNLSVTKKLLTINPQAGQQVIYRISYSNINGDAMTGVTLTDKYGSGLSYSNIVASIPILDTPIHDIGAKTLTFSGVSIAANTTGVIDIAFMTDIGLGSGMISNAVTCDASVIHCRSLKQQGSAISKYTVPILDNTPNANIDLEVNKYHGICAVGSNGSGCSDTQTVYLSGDFVYFTIEYKNNGTNTATNVGLIDWYDPALDFVSIEDTTTPGLLGTPHIYTELIQNFPFKRISFSDGFSLSPNQTERVVLKYKIISESGNKRLYNHVEIGSIWNTAMFGDTLTPRREAAYNGSSNIPPSSYSIHNQYEGLRKLQIDNESSQTNNFSQSQILLPTYDLQVSKELLTGTIGRGNEVSFRISFVNSGPARNNIVLNDILTAGQNITAELVSFSTGPDILSISNPLDFFNPFRIISLETNTSSYIDATFRYPSANAIACSTIESNNHASITIDGFSLDNFTPHKKLADQGNETSIVNNIFTLPMGLLPARITENCGGGVNGDEFDFSIKTSSPEVTAPILCPGDIVTITSTLEHDATSDLQKHPFLGSNLSNSLNNDAKNLMYIGKSSVGDASHYTPFSRNTPYMLAYLDKHEHVLDFNVNDFLDKHHPTYKDEDWYTGIPSEICPDFYGTGKVGRTIVNDTFALFKTTYYDRYHTLVAEGIPVVDAMMQGYARAYAQTYRYLDELDADELNTRYQGCDFARNVYILMHRDGYTRKEATNFASESPLVYYDKFSLLKDITSINIVVGGSFGPVYNPIGLMMQADYYIQWGVDTPAMVESIIMNFSKNYFNEKLLLDDTSSLQYEYHTSVCYDGIKNDEPDIVGCDYGNTGITQQAYLAQLTTIPSQLIFYDKDYAVSTRIGVTYEGYANRDTLYQQKNGYQISPGVTENYVTQYMIPDVPDGTTLTYQGVIGSTCDSYVSTCQTLSNGSLYRTAEEYNHNNNTDTLTFTVNCPSNPSRDNELSTIIQTSTTTAKIGDSIVDTITYCNDSETRKDSLGLDFTFGAELVYQSINGQVPTNQSRMGNVFHFTDISLNPGECKSFNVNFIAKTDGTPINQVIFGKIFNNIIITGNEKNQANNVTEIQTEIVTPFVETFMPSFQKILNTPILNTAGEAISYTISYQNTSMDTHIVTVTDMFSSKELNFVGSDIQPSTVTNGSVIWKDIVVNAQQTITFMVDFTLQYALKAGDSLLNNIFYNTSYGKICTPVIEKILSNNHDAVNTILTLPVQFVTGTISTGMISTGTISTGMISTGTISTGTTSTGTISTGTISTGTISTIPLFGGTIIPTKEKQNILLTYNVKQLPEPIKKLFEEKVHNTANQLLSSGNVILPLVLPKTGGCIYDMYIIYIFLVSFLFSSFTFLKK